MPTIIDTHFIGQLGHEYALQADSYTVDRYNSRYNQAYAYYWLEYGSASDEGDPQGYPLALWGSYSVRTDSQVYFVAML